MDSRVKVALPLLFDNANKIIRFEREKPKSVIKALREKFPDEGWQAKQTGSGWVYENNKGEQAWWGAAVLAPRYDGDDATFRSEFWIYRKSGAERLW